MLQKVQLTLFFCEVPKVENFDKKCLTLSKENQNSAFKHIRFCRSESLVKGLSKLKVCYTNHHFITLFIVLTFSGNQILRKNIHPKDFLARSSL
jgi:hypothetical protein